MNRIQKFIIYILAAAVVLGTMTAPTFAAVKPKDGSGLLTALEIFDGSESAKSDAAVTRADAVYYALKVTGHDVAAANSYDSFADVSAQTARADAIQAGLGCGMISPAENFRPDAAVTMSEFAKMIASGLNYDGIAQAMGAYPQGYMALARRQGWDGSMGGVTDKSTIPYSKLAVLLTNVLMSGYIEQNGLYEYETAGNDNLLYKLFNVYQTAGILTANSVTTLVYPGGVGENKVQIGNTTFNVRSDLYANLASYLGYNLNYWVIEDDTASNDEIICFEDKNTEVIEVFSEDFTSIENGKLTCEEKGRKKTYILPASCSVIYNGKASTTSVRGDVFKGKWGSVRLIKPTGDKIETVIITAYENYYAGSIDKDNFAVYDNTANNRFISFKNDEGELSEYAYFRDNTGKGMKFSDIAASSVLSVAANGDYYDVIVVKETVSGTVTSVYSDEDGLFVQLDANTYKLAPEMDTSRIGAIKAGNSYTFYLDAGFRIAAGVAGALAGDDMDWAYLIDIIKGENDNGECLYFRMLLKSGDIQRVVASQNIKIDGRSYKKANIEEIRSLFLANETVVRSQVIRFSVDDNGEINVIDTLTTNTEFENDTDCTRQICDNSVQRIFKGNRRTFGTDFAFGGKTIIFKTPDNVAAKADKGDSDEYGVATTDIWSEDVNYYVSAYNSNVYSYTADVIVTTGAGGTISMDNQTHITVVTSVATVDYDGEILVEVKGLQDNNEKTWYLNDNVEKISENTFITITDKEKEEGVDAFKIAKGDAIRFDTDVRGRVTKIQVIYDCSEDKFMLPTNSSSVGALNGYSRLQVGMASPYRIYDGYIVSVINSELAVGDPSNTRIINQLSNYKVYVVDMTENTITVSTSSAIRDWYNYGEENCSRMLMQNRYNEGRTIVIYKD